jgi:hypothetical protein
MVDLATAICWRVAEGVRNLFSTRGRRNMPFGIPICLGDIVVPFSTPAEEDVDEEALAREVEAGFRGQPPLSDTILEERRRGL